MHIFKLPPALPALHAEMGFGLVESGFLLSIIQFAGMMLGLSIGLLAERIGLRRCVLCGLAIIVAASSLTVLVDSVGMMMALRAIEGCGFYMVVMPIPALIRRLVPASMLSRIMGVWSSYMPLGTILILIVGAWVLSVSTWRTLWLALSLLTFAAFVLTWASVPADEPYKRGAKPAALLMVRQTLSTLPVWWVALTFGMYAAQWISIVGFLPTIYAQAGIAGTTAGLLTGLVAGANIIGNLVAGQLLHRGVRPRHLLLIGFTTMIVCAYIAFGAGVSTQVQFIAVTVLSAVGGLIPATMFVVALAVAPTPYTGTTTIGWMQQGSSMGQFAGPPIVAWVVSVGGGWEYTWLATAAFALMGIGLAVLLDRSTQSRQLAV